MVLEGGVAGAQPLHKGGRLRPTAHKKEESLESWFARLIQGCESVVAA